jgi:hypothetical protein
MGFFSERFHLARARYHDRQHRYDNVSTIPKELFVKAMDRPGIHRTVVLSNMPSEIREVVKADITQRVHANVVALPKRLQFREDEVVETITAVVAHNGYLAGETGFLAATESAFFENDLMRKRQCAWIMRETGLIEVFWKITPGGIAHDEHWRLSKKIDPVLQKND